MGNQELKKAGLKATIPRMKILQILENSDKHHLSAEEIYRILLESEQDIGLATIYRVLTQFEAAGIVNRLNFEGGHSVFEMDQGEHHDHLVCILCGAVAEFVDDIIEERQKQIATEQHFKMTDHSLIIYGECQTCQGDG